MTNTHFIFFSPLSHSRIREWLFFVLNCIATENKALLAYCDKEGLTYRQDRTQIYGYIDPKRKKKPIDFIETVDKSGESGIIKAGHNLAEKRRFNFEDYPIADNPESVRQAQNYASENLGINNIRGFEKLTDGDTALQIFQRLKTLKSEYKKSYSSVSVLDYGDERTIAETVINELRLNSRFMNSPAAVKAILDEWAETGFIPKGCNNIDYVANHEFFHLLTQDFIDEPHSKIIREIIRAKVPAVSANSEIDAHEYVADLLNAVTLTKSQQKLKQKILDIVRKGEG